MRSRSRRHLRPNMADTFQSQMISQYGADWNTGPGVRAGASIYPDMIRNRRQAGGNAIAATDFAGGYTSSRRGGGAVGWARSTPTGAQPLDRAGETPWAAPVVDPKGIAFAEPAASGGSSRAEGARGSEEFPPEEVGTFERLYAFKGGEFEGPLPDAERYNARVGLKEGAATRGTSSQSPRTTSDFLRQEQEFSRVAGMSDEDRKSYFRVAGREALDSYNEWAQNPLNARPSDWVLSLHEKQRAYGQVSGTPAGSMAEMERRGRLAQDIQKMQRQRHRYFSQLRESMARDADSTAPLGKEFYRYGGARAYQVWYDRTSAARLAQFNQDTGPTRRRLAEDDLGIPLGPQTLGAATEDINKARAARGRKPVSSRARRTDENPKGPTRFAKRR